MNKAVSRKLVSILAMSILLGCASQLKPGRYVNIKSPEEIILNGDGTFEYQYRWHIFFRKSKGTWSKIGKSEIELNSYSKEKNFVLTATDKIDDNTLSISVPSLMPHPSSYECFIFINDSLSSICNCDSIYIPQEKIPFEIKDFFVKIHSISNMPVRFFDTAISNKYFPSQATGNNIVAEVVVNDSLFNYRVFDNTRVKVRGNKLLFYDSTFKRNTILKTK